LPPPTAQNYSLRSRPHNRQLPDRISRITDCNFTVRMLYRNMYWLVYILDMRFVLFLCTTAVWQFAMNEYVMLCYVMLQTHTYKTTISNKQWFNLILSNKLQPYTFHKATTSSICISDVLSQIAVKGENEEWEMRSERNEKREMREMRILWLRQAADVDWRDRQTEGRTDGHPTVT